MAKNAVEKANANNLESNKGNGYTITFGNFDENEKGEMNFPPQNAKSYKNKDFKEALKTGAMVIEAKSYTKVLGKDGKVVARVAEDGKVLSGKLPKEKSSKNSDEQVKD